MAYVIAELFCVFAMTFISLTVYVLTGLGMENIGGIFVVLICGLIIAVFVAIMEFVWSTRRSVDNEEVRKLGVRCVICQCVPCVSIYIVVFVVLLQHQNKMFPSPLPRWPHT